MIKKLLQKIKEIFFPMTKEIPLYQSPNLNPSGYNVPISKYGEGLWYPQLKFGEASTGLTYDWNDGMYIRLGNLVILFYNINLSAKGTSTGDVTISGLPFAINGDHSSHTGGIVEGMHNTVRFSNLATSFIEVNTSTWFDSGGNSVLLLSGRTAASTLFGNTLQDTDIQNNSILGGMFIYRTLDN